MTVTNNHKILKITFLILLVSVGLSSCLPHSKTLKKTFEADVENLMSICKKSDEYLIDKNTAALKDILNEEVNWKHTNGYLQNKNEIIQDINNKKIEYVSITPLSNVEWKIQDNNNINITRQVSVLGKYENNEFKMNLEWTDEWKKEKNNWQLKKRTSTKI